MDAKIRASRAEYWQEILELYQSAASDPGEIARTSDGISSGYVRNFLKKSRENGLSLLAFEGMRIIGEIHAYPLEQKVFSHVLSDLTVVVHPEYVGKGIGKALFSAFLEEIQATRPDILRIELIARESNRKAILLYESLGFKQEGRLEKRVDSGNGTFEADIPMAWINPKFGNLSRS